MKGKQSRGKRGSETRSLPMSGAVLSKGRVSSKRRIPSLFRLEDLMHLSLGTLSFQMVTRAAPCVPEKDDYTRTMGGNPQSFIFVWFPFNPNKSHRLQTTSLNTTIRSKNKTAKIIRTFWDAPAKTAVAQAPGPLLPPATPRIPRLRARNACQLHPWQRQRAAAGGKSGDGVSCG